jgi:hypothetical protein
MPWWIDTTAGWDWTIEEQKTRRRIAVIAPIAFFPVFMIEMWLLNRLGVDRNLGALLDLASSAIFGFLGCSEDLSLVLARHGEKSRRECRETPSLATIRSLTRAMKIFS